MQKKNLKIFCDIGVPKRGEGGACPLGNFSHLIPFLFLKASLIYIVSGWTFKFEILPKSIAIAAFLLPVDASWGAIENWVRLRTLLCEADKVGTWYVCRHLWKSPFYKKQKTKIKTNQDLKKSFWESISGAGDKKKENQQWWTLVQGRHVCLCQLWHWPFCGYDNVPIPCNMHIWMVIKCN